MKKKGGIMKPLNQRRILRMNRGWQEEDRLQWQIYYIGFGGRKQADLPFLNGPWHICETTRAFLRVRHTCVWVGMN